MKIEMGESLFYSWLRHVKECQIVQANWTTSSQWQLSNEDRLEEIMTQTDKFFFDKYGYSIYKKSDQMRFIRCALLSHPNELIFFRLIIDMFFSICHHGVIPPAMCCKDQ